MSHHGRPLDVADVRQTLLEQFSDGYFSVLQRLNRSQYWYCNHIVISLIQISYIMIDKRWGIIFQCILLLTILEIKSSSSFFGKNFVILLKSLVPPSLKFTVENFVAYQKFYSTKFPPLRYSNWKQAPKRSYETQEIHLPLLYLSSILHLTTNNQLLLDYFSIGWSISSAHNPYLETRSRSILRENTSHRNEEISITQKCFQELPDTSGLENVQKRFERFDYCSKEKEII